MKNIYTIGLTAVTAVCIFAGLWFQFGYSGEEINDNRELTSFQSIDVIGDEMRLRIEQGNGYAVAYHGRQELEPVISVEGGVLKIEQKERKTRGFLNHKSTASITVTVPETVLESVGVKLDVGDMDIEKIQSSKCTVQSDVGDIRIQTCTVGDVYVETDVGDIELSNIQFDRLEILCDVGDVDVETAMSLDELNIDCTLDIGDIKINGERHGRNYQQTGDGKSVTITGNIGDITLSAAGSAK